MNAIFATVLGSFLVVGCTTPATPEWQGTVTMPPESLVLRTVHKDVALANGVMLGGAEAPQHVWVEPGPSGALTLDVSPHAGALVVELIGTAAQGHVLLHAIPPSATDQTPMLVDASTLYAEQDESGDARLVIEGPQPGRWEFDLHADGLVLDFRGTLYVTSLVGVPAAPFTAVPAPS